jgi:hypothetical protein
LRRYFLHFKKPFLPKWPYQDRRDEGYLCKTGKVNATCGAKSFHKGISNCLRPSVIRKKVFLPLDEQTGHSTCAYAAAQAAIFHHL